MNKKLDSFQKTKDAFSDKLQDQLIIFLNEAIEEYFYTQNVTSFQRGIKEFMELSGGAEACAFKIGVACSQAYALANGGCRPNFTTLLRIFKAFNLIPQIKRAKLPKKNNV